MSGTDFVQGAALSPSGEGTWQDGAGTPVSHKAVLYLQFTFIYSILFLYFIINQVYLQPLTSPRLSPPVRRGGMSSLVPTWGLLQGFVLQLPWSGCREKGWAWVMP